MKERIEGFYKRNRRLIGVVAFGILLYEALENFPALWGAAVSVLAFLKPVFFGIGLAFVANMPMRFLESRVFKKWKASKLKRVVCLLLSMLFILSIVGLLIFVLIPMLAQSVRLLVENLDEYVAELSAWADGVWQRLNLSDGVQEKVRTAAQSLFLNLDTLLASAATAALKITVNLVTGVFSFLVALIFSVYALFRKETLLLQLKKLVLALFRQAAASRILDVCARANTMFNRYFFGMMAECAILGTLCFIGMQILGFPYPLLISFTVGITQMAPIIGPWASGILGALIILMVNPPMALWFIVFIIAVQQIEENLFYPRVVGNAVGLSGMWVIVAMLLFGGLFGITGIVLAVPVMAVLYTLLSDWVNARIRKKEAEQAPPGEEEPDEDTQE
ncbi:MAG: AI-2E family transporter [Clostridiaceae bacterium]|nr:AI-2E family transporter [Eubacteriales bacterium]